MGKQASSMNWLLERSSRKLDREQNFCASFARSTAHLIVKTQPESAHLMAHAHELRNELSAVSQSSPQVASPLSPVGSQLPGCGSATERGLPMTIGIALS